MVAPVSVLALFIGGSGVKPNGGRLLKQIYERPVSENITLFFTGFLSTIKKKSLSGKPGQIKHLCKKYFFVEKLVYDGKGKIGSSRSCCRIILYYIAA